MTAAIKLPLRRPSPYRPPEEHIRLRDEMPIARVTLPNGQEVWVLSRLNDIRAMLRDPRFSSDRDHPNLPFLANQGRVNRKIKPTLIQLDPPAHTAARKAVVGEFTAKRMDALRPRIQHHVDKQIDAMLAGPRSVDLVQALALPVPSLVMCELLGVPYDEHDFFQERSLKLISYESSKEERDEAMAEFRAYMADLIARKEKDPGDDLLTRQLEKSEDREELVSLAVLLLVAGHDTTANMISLGVMALLEHPDVLAAIRADPSKTPNAVEELLRYFSVAQFALGRVATEDVEIGGVLIHEGDGVLGLGQAANRDPEMFDHADEIDILRNTRHHIGFGSGIHQCLGQSMARIELVIVFDTLFERIPGLRLAEPSIKLTYKDNALVYGLHALPVTW